MEGLTRLVNDVEALGRAWERETVVSTALGDFDDVLTVASLEAVIAGSLPLAAARLFREGEFLPATPMTRPPARRGRNARRLVHGPGVLRQIKEGATLALEELQLYCPAVARLTDAVAAETGYTVDSTAFLTPARATGAGPHRDQVSFFLRQVAGSKRWRVWPAEAGEPEARPQPAVVAERTPPEIDVLLKEGDCIYIPRDRIHVGQTLDEPSVHLSIGVWHRTWAQALADLIARSADGELRELLPPAFSGGATGGPALLPERVSALRTWLDGANWAAIAPATAPAIGARPGLQEALDRR